MKLLTVLLIALAGVSCTSANGVSDFFDRLEFKEGQEGCIRATGAVNIGSNPLLRSDVNVNLVKTQGDNAPDC